MKVLYFLGMKKGLIPQVRKNHQLEMKIKIAAKGVIWLNWNVGRLQYDFNELIASIETILPSN